MKKKMRIEKTSKFKLERAALLNRRGFGINEVIGIAAGIIIAAAIIIPGLKEFSGTVIAQLTTWWSSLAAEIFQG
ncbi:MAG: hypothetical protein GX028_12915 [Clostridiaceae bacterium]|nr:hypothetical protein [Clostridiaceae bacterium]